MLCTAKVRWNAKLSLSIILQFLPPSPSIGDCVKIRIDEILFRIHDWLEVFWWLGDGRVENACVDERRGGNCSLDVVEDDGVGWVIAFCLWSPDHFGFRSGGAQRGTLWIGGAPHGFSKEGLLSVVYGQLKLFGVHLSVADTLSGIANRVFPV